MGIFNRLGQKFADFFGENTELDALTDKKRPLADFLDPDYLSDILSYRLYDPERKIYENKTSFGFVLEVIPLLGGTQDAQKELSSLIKEIGEEQANIQCLIFADYRIDRFLHLWSEPRNGLGGIFQKIAERKKEF